MNVDSAVALAAACLLGAVACAGPTAATPASSREAVAGLPCEECEAVFEGLPETLTWSVRIAPPEEPGEPMRIDGTVVDEGGRPVSGIVVYAYHTNAKGIYPRGDRSVGSLGYRHGRLRGWAKSDEKGRYRFETIRPASYPNRKDPAHVHMHVLEPGRCTYYIDDILFDDDPLLPATLRRHAAKGRGGNGIVTPAKDGNGGWTAVRDIVLGEGIPGYPARPEPR